MSRLFCLLHNTTRALWLSLASSLKFAPSWSLCTPSWALPVFPGVSPTDLLFEPLVEPDRCAGRQTSGTPCTVCTFMLILNRKGDSTSIMPLLRNITPFLEIPYFFSSFKIQALYLALSSKVSRSFLLLTLRLLPHMLASLTFYCNYFLVKRSYWAATRHDIVYGFTWWFVIP